MKSLRKTGVSWVSGLFFALALGAPISASAADLRVVTFNVQLGVDAPGTVSHQAARQVLSRIDADVVALQEVQDGDLVGNPSHLQQFASALGYPEIHVPDTDGVLDFIQRSCFLSRFPIKEGTDISPPAGARDMTRRAPAIVVDVPGIAADPTIVNLHLKCCLDPDDPFRRAVELHRITAHLSRSGLGSRDNLIVLGDFNLLGPPRSYTTIPSSLPPGFTLGEDIPIPLTYFADPASYFGPWSLAALDARQLNRSPFTAGNDTLDFILATPALTSRPHASEIYNSSFDSAGAGLPKAGAPPPARTSTDASDHLAVFADFELGDLPPLSLQLDKPSVQETDPAGAATLSVTLPAPPGPGESVTVELASSDSTEAIVPQSALTFSTGTQVLHLDVVPQPDGVLDGDQSVTFTVTSPGLAAARIELIVVDSDQDHYRFTAPGQTIREDFRHFDGSADPAEWSTSGGVWRGRSDGSSGVPGNFAYGHEPSLGFLLDSDPVSATARIHNDSPNVLTALEIRFDAEQWRSSQHGTRDTLQAELVDGDGVLPLPRLAFTADHSLPSGPVPDGAATTLQTQVAGLAIPPGESIQLRFTAARGPGGGEPWAADIFVNELHYDNVSSDIDEFVEIVVAPGGAVLLPDASLVLYNGNDGRPYASHPLHTFVEGETTPSGHRIYWKPITAIQNGSPDGLAVVAGGSVLDFLSYEGAFSARGGPAVGLTSRDIGVRQDNPVPPRFMESLGLTGESDSASGFVWTRFSGEFTPGLANPGQSFLVPAGPQGIAIDNLSVTFLPDTDQDGLPDRLENRLGTNPLAADSDGDGTLDPDEDADRDGQSNLAELSLTLTDPLNRHSQFRAPLSRDHTNPDLVRVAIETLPGRRYTIERSADLRTWQPLATHVGDGARQLIPLSSEDLGSSSFFRVSVSRP